MSSNLSLIFSEFNLNMASDSKRIAYVFEDYRLDAANRLLYRGDVEISLPPKAIETLLALVVRRGEVLSKDDLMKIIWADVVVEESNLSHYLYVLRKTLGNRRDGQPFIETLRRRGYRFSSEVQIIEEPAEPKNFTENSSIDSDAHFDKTTLWEKNTASVYNSNHHAKGRTVFSTHWSLILATLTFAAVSTLTTFLYFQFQPVKNTPVSARAEMSVTHLTNGNSTLLATISPDGKYFVYHEQDGDITRLWLQQTGQPNRIEIIPASQKRISAKTFSPDGEFIYFIAGEMGENQDSLYRVPTLGGTVTKVLTDIATPVSFSPDGKEMVFGRHNENAGEFAFVIAASDGSKERLLLAGSGMEMNLFGGSAWSPDGKMIAFGACNVNSSIQIGACSLYGIEMQTGVIKTLSTEKWDTCYRMAWTRDGEGLVFIGTRAGDSYTMWRDVVYYVSASTGESRRITTDGNRHDGWSLGVTDDNSVLILLTNRASQIWAMNSNGDSRTAVQLTTGQADGRAGLAPLPDGRIGYITRSGEILSVWTMNSDGTDRKQITNEPSFIEELRASPDGRYFVFSGRRDGQNHLFRIDANGGNLKQLTEGDTIECDSTISPDGKRIIYFNTLFEGKSLKNRIWKVSIEGGAPIHLNDTEYFTSVPHFSPDGKFISNVRYENRISVETENGTPVKTFETVATPFLNIGALWMPDGKSLTYNVYRKNVYNIWQQPINGGEPRQLTDFTSGDIYRYAFSSDGSRIYLARGYSTRNAVLIKNFKR